MFELRAGLLRLSLCQGSLADGLFQHDIIRDYAMSRCPNLPERQSQIVQAILDETLRPNDGWAEADSVGQGTLGWYVATHTRWHIKGAFNGSGFQSLLQRLVVADSCVIESCALALGEVGVDEQAELAVLEGRVLDAARIILCGVKPVRHGRLRAGKEAELLRRCQVLLSSRLPRDRVANELELSFMARLINLANASNFDEVLHARDVARISEIRQNLASTAARQQSLDAVR